MPVSYTHLDVYKRQDIACAFECSLKTEKSPIGKGVIEQLIENSKIAAEEKVPLCQDTGMAVFFVEYGQNVVVEGGSFEDAINEGVRKAYVGGYLRKSVVRDPVLDLSLIHIFYFCSYSFPGEIAPLIWQRS